MPKTPDLNIKKRRFIKHYGICIAGLLTFLSLLQSVPIDTKASELKTYKLGSTNGIYSNDNANHILPGDSREYVLSVKREQEDRKRRELLSRDKPRRGGSYTQGEAEVIGESWENCVQYVKRITGIQRTLGGGGRMAINSYEPQVGAIGVEKNRVHATVITKIEGDKITIEEANFYRGKITRRVINRSDFMGYIL